MKDCMIDIVGRMCGVRKRRWKNGKRLDVQNFGSSDGEAECVLTVVRVHGMQRLTGS